MNALQNSYCRLCAQSKPQSELREIKTDYLEEIVNKLVRLNCFLDYKDDVLPKTVCLLCINLLNQAIDFVEAFDHAQLVLKDLITSQPIKNEIVDSFGDIVHQLSNDKYDDSDITTESELIQENNRANSLALIDKTKAMEYKDKEYFPVDAILPKLNLTWRDYNWKCAYCETQFPTIIELKNHSMKYHNSCSAYRCTECNSRLLSLDSLITHVRSHREYLKTSCYKCFKEFSSTYITHKHKIVHTTSDFKCDGCNTHFVSLQLLNEHIQTFYKNSQSDNKQQFEEDSLTCLKCKKTYKTKAILRKHLLIHTDRQRDHTCEVCGKCFLNNYSLAKHMILHDNVRPFQCETCKLSFKTKDKLYKHVGVHDGKKPYVCEKCGKGFRLQKQLKSHSVIHTDLLPFVCTCCNKGFRFRSTLIQHKRQHTGVKPYECMVCGKDFSNWSNYNKHMKCRHSMDMAKKKHTANGFFPIDSTTVEVIYPEINKVKEFKNILEKRNPGRSNLLNKIVVCKENINVVET